MKQTLKKTILLTISVLGMAAVPIFVVEPNLEPVLAKQPPVLIGELSFAQFNALLPIPSPTPEKVVKTIRVVVTAYSSTVDQTDDTPFITASGTRVRDGIVAANFLPIGTKIKLPDIYGDRIFVVEDRMHPRKKYMVDIWFASYTEAKEFGAKLTYVEVLEG
ncbi:3D domain-containing protein [Patescibacteria group bacterium]|nr:3D domain-containing protein [Patescibacteria group bacterium]